MKNRCKYTMMAALAVVGAILMGCAGEDMANEAPQAKNGNKVIQTTTISLGGSASTRALDADGKKTFAVGDQIAIYYKNTSDELQLAESTALTANDISSDGKTATIKVEMTDPKPESQLRYIYPAAMGRTDIEPAEEIENTINYEKLSDDQDGTLATLASKFDLAVYDGKLTSNSELPGSATLKNLLAIAEFTIKDYSGNDITSLITQLDIAQGSNKVIINRTAAAGPIYVAMSPCSDEDISIIATDGTNSYEKTATAKSLAANTMTPVTMKMQKVVDLSKLTADYEAQDGEVLTGTLDGKAQPYKITIADGATVTLDGVTINGVSSSDVKWAGITCLGDATIILKDGSKNTVKGFYEDYPGIQAGPTGKTLVIKGEDQGTGSLDASPYDGGTEHSYGAGIGGGLDISCGDINIQGGVITVTGGYGAAGIGIGEGYEEENVSYGTITISDGTVIATGGHGAAGIGGGYAYQYGVTFGAITISGGTVTAAGGDYAAGIGSGESYSGKNTCGDITITADVTSVTATKGKNATNSIGAGNSGTCGTVTIGGDATTYAAGVAESPFVYPTPSVALSAVTSTDYLGWRICSDGKAYAAAGPLPSGVTAVAMIAYVGSNTGEAAYNHGLALALKEAPELAAWDNRAEGQANLCLGTQYADATAATSDMDGMANTTTLAGHTTPHSHPAAVAASEFKYKDDVAAGAHPTGTSGWFLPSVGQWDEMIGTGGYGLANMKLTSGDYTGLEDAGYWLSTEKDDNNAWNFIIGQNVEFVIVAKHSSVHVRSCLAF